MIGLYVIVFPYVFRKYHHERELQVSQKITYGVGYPASHGHYHWHSVRRMGSARASSSQGNPNPNTHSNAHLHRDANPSTLCHSDPRPNDYRRRYLENRSQPERGHWHVRESSQRG